MKQILQSLKNGETELAEVPVPMIKSGALLIKSSCSLISTGTERMLLNFGKANWIDKARQQPDKVKQVLQKIKTDGLMPTVDKVFSKLDNPVALGYSNVGTVLEVGKGVVGFKPGDRVVSNGFHAEVVCVGANLCAKIPDEVDDATACFTVVSSIALEGIRLIKPSLGENIAVIGLGLIGLLTVQILKANGCRVIGFDFDSKKVELAKSYGVEAHCVSDGTDPVALAMSFSKGYGVDGVIITAATSSNAPAHQAPQMCRKRGRVVLIGVVGLELSRDDFYKKEISFQVSCSYGPGRYDENYEGKGLDYPIGFVRWTEQRNFEAVLNLMAENKLRVKELISQTVDFNNAIKAYDLVSQSRDVLGLILKYDGNVDINKRSVTLKKTEQNLTSNSEKPIIGFIGAGNYASGILVPAFAATNAVLKTIASSGGISGTHVGNKNGFYISTTDISRIYDDPEINTVVITTRHNQHAQMVIDALKNGKNVFVEKPLCMNEQELQQIKEAYLEAQKKKPVRLMVGFNRRFSPLTQAAVEQLRKSNEPSSIIITVNSGFIPADHWTQDSETGGGRLIGEACHFVDLIRFLANSPITSVNTIRMSGNGQSPSDTATITVTTENGSIGTVHYFSNGSKDFPKERIEVFTGGKIVQIDNFKTINFYGWNGAKNQSLWAQDKGQKNCCESFVEAISSGKPSPINIDEIFEVTSDSFFSME